MKYRGRFAPSPTGPLHFGSMVAAVASYCDARHHSGEWLVRIEDVDEPRSVPGAAGDILRSLEAFGLTWDGEVMFQSRRTAIYCDALEYLKAQRLAYPCGCSRKDTDERYAGTCREGLAPGRGARAWRIRSSDGVIAWTDRGFGEQHGAPDDFILLRADGLFAYQLAVVVDDAAQAITHVVRGADLLDSTPRQIYLQRLLGYPTPDYLHVPMALNEDGQKLSKQTRAPAIAADPEQLSRVLAFLKQNVPAGLSMVEMLNHAVRHWPGGANVDP